MDGANRVLDATKRGESATEAENESATDAENAGVLRSPSQARQLETESTLGDAARSAPAQVPLAPPPLTPLGFAALALFALLSNAPPASWAGKMLSVA